MSSKTTRIILFLLLAVLGNITTLQAEEGDRDCHATQFNDAMRKLYPEMVKKQMEIERQTQDFANKSVLMRSEKVYKIPVVILNPYNTTSEKLTEAQVEIQLAILNDDFRRLNRDQTDNWKQAADVKIEFVLAKVDPRGNPTNGIVQRFTGESFFNPDNRMKFSKYGGIDAWPADQYLNIWVCDLRGNKMGYAQFPGGPKSTDGVVIDYKYFGKTNSRNYGLGRTTTHEVGHWLNLRHIWGDGDCSRDDFVHDTPTASYPSYGCQSGKVSCGSLDMTSNYMDYSYDRCMNLFTEGQKVRMRALFQPGGFRESLLQSPGLGDDNNDTEIIAANDQEEEEVEQVACIAPSNLVASIDGRYLSASWETADEDAKHVHFEIRPSYSTRWFKFTLNRNQVSIAGIQSGYSYDIRITTVCGDGSVSAPTEILGLTSASRLVDGGAIRYNNPAINFLNIEWDPSQLTPENYRNGRLVQIDAEDMYKEEPVQVRRIMIQDVTGRTIYDRRVNPGTYFLNINVETIQHGFYVIQFLDGSGGPPIQTKKVIIGNSRSRGGP